MTELLIWTELKHPCCHSILRNMHYTTIASDCFWVRTVFPSALKCHILFILNMSFWLILEATPVCVLLIKPKFVREKNRIFILEMKKKITTLSPKEMETSWMVSFLLTVSWPAWVASTRDAVKTDIICILFYWLFSCATCWCYLVSKHQTGSSASSSI